MKRSVMIVWLLAALSLLLVGCSTNVRKSEPGESPSAALEQARNEVRDDASKTLQRLYAERPGSKQAVEHAAGYAVFNTFGVKVLVAGGGAGKGMAVNNATGQEVFMRMAQIQAGLGFSIKKSRLIWVFETQSAFKKFVTRGYQLGGQASLVAQASGYGGGFAGAASISPGVWLYQLTDDGLAVDLTVQGTKYYRDEGLN